MRADDFELGDDDDYFGLSAKRKKKKKRVNKSMMPGSDEAARIRAQILMKQRDNLQNIPEESAF